MINIPDHKDLTDTANGWLNLAWEQTLGAVTAHAEMVSYIEESELGVADDKFTRLWNAHRHRLNNALQLCQQAMELYLKARIAEVSPFLLIVGEPRQWPSGDNNNTVDFLDFRTLESAHLCRAASLVGKQPLSTEHKTFFEDLRKSRNKIAHLHAGNFPAEAKARLRDCLEAFRLTYPDIAWQQFRKNYIVQTELHGPHSEYDYDFNHTVFLNEFETAIETLDNADCKKHFGLDKRKPRLRCPNCEDLRQKHDTEELRFAQLRADGRVSCTACLTSFARADYDKLAADYWNED